ncbi:cytochrome P450 [Roridomyces roridus]|uniref:Cytochrome P450 n=1 Tax=Roridomyces roridus TaxID=1738132 RepID=A0AAD7BE43_9AGAR|nr:cytochrome P450 [Roridomyces roridus]
MLWWSNCYGSVYGPQGNLPFYQSERSVYVKTETDKIFIGNIFWTRAFVDMHKLQRKALTPAFSSPLETIWDATLESDGTVIEVQSGCAHLGGSSHQTNLILDNLDSIGIAGFSLPTGRMRVFWELRRSLKDIAERLPENTRKEKDGNVAEELTGKSVIGLLGYETTSVALTASPLSPTYTRQPRLILPPDKLRPELAWFSLSDLTWDQLVSELPFLDTTALEVLRLHPPVVSTIRVALWGADAKEWKPSRWLEEITVSVRELQHCHLLTFHEGPRACLSGQVVCTGGNLKPCCPSWFATLFFEFPDGPETKMEKHIAIVPRPKVAGQSGDKVPLMVRR